MLWIKYLLVRLRWIGLIDKDGVVMGILEELRNGNVSFLASLTLVEKETIVELISSSEDCDDIFRIILPIFKSTDNWYDMATSLFYKIYLKRDFEEYIICLLEKEYVPFEELDISVILRNTSSSWFLEYILRNLEKLPRSEFHPLIDYLKGDQKWYSIFFNKVLRLSNQKIRETFILTSIMKKVDFDMRDIVKTFYQEPSDFYHKRDNCKDILLNSSHLPVSLLFYARNYPELEKVMVEYFELFFQAEAEQKMRFFDYFVDRVPEDFLDKYRDFLKLYQHQKTRDIDRKLTILVNHDHELLISDFLKEKKTAYIGSGSTTSVFRVGKQILKLSLRKHEPNTERDLFLIAPTELQMVYGNNFSPILYVEKQPYLSKTHNGQEMTKMDIQCFFEELDRQGFELTDPYCINFSFDNFGFLDDYHDANITGFASADDLPEWFKKRPIVLYDVDLVYRKECVKKKTFKPYWC